MAYQSILNPMPVTGTFFQTTQPVSIATMPSTPVTGVFWQTTQPVSGTVTINAIPTGANTIGNVGLVAGAAVIGAVTQSGTWNIGTVTTLPALPANQSVNAAQINGVAPLMGNGVTGTGSQRVTIASDNTAFSVNAVQSGTWNVGSITTLPALATGANTIGAVNIAAAQTVAVTQATAANLNATVVQATAANFNATVTPATPTASIINSAATTNATSIKGSAGTVYGVTVSNAGAAAVFVKLYNSATAPTVGTTLIALTIPIAASGIVNINFGETGMRFGTGIALAITNLVAEADATAVALNQVKVLTSYI